MNWHAFKLEYFADTVNMVSDMRFKVNADLTTGAAPSMNLENGNAMAGRSALSEKGTGESFLHTDLSTPLRRPSCMLQVILPELKWA